MPQVIRVVRCYKCETFQADIEKQSNKWICRLCNEKQSLKKVYDSGIGKDCRKLVQELNDLRFKTDSLNKKLELISSSAQVIETPEKDTPVSNAVGPACSKWEQFIEKTIPMSSDEDEMQVSTPKKKISYLSKAARGDENVGNIEFLQISDPEQKCATKAKKTPLFTPQNESNAAPLAKHTENTFETFKKDQSKTTVKSKWLQYLDENTVDDEDLPESKKEMPTKCGVNCAKPLSNSSSNANLDWETYTEWDTFSEPHSPASYNGSIKEGDPFEEFECNLDDAKPIELFSTVDNNDDLDAIFTL